MTMSGPETETDVQDADKLDQTCLDNQASNPSGRDIGQSHDKLKSGYEVVNQADVVTRVLWPHGFLSKLQNYTNTKPDNLNFESFFYG